jgi:hypothetical protein
MGGSIGASFLWKYTPIRKHTVLLAAMVAVSATLLASVPATAATYYFKPGHPMFFGGPGVGTYCTGGYVIRGTSGMFPLTDGHCAGVGTTVYGTDRAFGTVSYTKWSTWDTELISEVPGDDAYQIVVDPRTGRTPGSGRVVGYKGSSSFVNGYLVGKMGVTTGWTEGVIYNTSTWHNMTCYWSRAYTQPGDSGGPVWRWEPNGVWALGITMAYARWDGDGPPGTLRGNGCFVSIGDLLAVWGAWLPVFNSASFARGPATPAAPPTRLPQLDLGTPAVGKGLAGTR